MSFISELDCCRCMINSCPSLLPWKASYGAYMLDATYVKSRRHHQVFTNTVHDLHGLHRAYLPIPLGQKKATSSTCILQIDIFMC